MFNDLLKDSSVDVVLLKKLRDKASKSQEFSSSEEKKIQSWVKRLMKEDLSVEEDASQSSSRDEAALSSEKMQIFLNRLYKDLI